MATNREQIDRLARQRGVRVDGLDDMAAARAVISAATGKDASGESSGYISAAVAALAAQSAPAELRDAPERVTRFDAGGAEPGAAAAAHARMRLDHEDGWRQPLLASKDEVLPRGRAYAHTDSADALRGTVAGVRADAARESERAWQTPLRATKEAAFARDLEAV